jgi:hypothetical protein
MRLTNRIQSKCQVITCFVWFVSSRSRRYSASVRMTWQLKRHWYWTATMKSMFGLDYTQMLHPRSKHSILGRSLVIQNSISYAFSHNFLWSMSVLCFYISADLPSGWYSSEQKIDRNNGVYCHRRGRASIFHQLLQLGQFKAIICKFWAHTLRDSIEWSSPVYPCIELIDWLVWFCVLAHARW